MPNRSQNGLVEAAAEMHQQFNKRLECPTCSFHCDRGGAFNKDSGGHRDKKGHYYRRFRCRSQPRCGKTLGVIEFVKLCRQVDSKSVDGILKRFTGSSNSKSLI